MKSREDKRWELIQEAVAADMNGRSPRLFSSQRTLFGIPSELDKELARIAAENQKLHPSVSSSDASKPHTPPRAGKAQRVVHPLAPVYDKASRVLILGTIPSPKSRETGFYYNHPTNRFWPVLARLFDEPRPQTNDEKRLFVLAHHIALWDVLAECTIEGARDGSIAECVPNPVGTIIARAPIAAVFCTGSKAAELYARHCEADTHLPAHRLPSPSAANASCSLDDLVNAYRSILPFLSL